MSTDSDPDPDSDLCLVAHHSGSEPDPDSVSDLDRIGTGDATTPILAAADERKVRLCMIVCRLNQAGLLSLGV